MPKEQYEAMRALIPDAVRAIAYVLQNNGQRQSLDWWKLRSDTASKLLNKFSPDLKEVESTQKHKINDEYAELLRDIADRIAGKDTIGSDSSETGNG